MTISYRAMLGGVASTSLGYGINLVARFGVNVILTRLLTPEIFGMMLIINTLKLGAELLSDVGIAQTIINNPRGDERNFFSMVWTLALIRGIALAVIFALLAYPLSDFYGIPTLALQIVAVTFLIGGINTHRYYLLVRRLDFISMNLFDTATELAGLLLIALCAYVSPDVWGIVTGVVAGTLLRCVASFWLAGPPLHFRLSLEDTKEAMNYSRWIFASSILDFGCSNVDRLFLGKAVPLALAGTYSIARTIAELPIGLAGRLSSAVIFPIVSAGQTNRENLLKKLALPRLLFLIVAALGLSFLVATSDYFIRLVYDDRYWDAGWMLHLLLLGAWPAILCQVNENILLGLGKPSYRATATGLKLAYLAVALPAGFAHYGLWGAIAAFAAGDVLRLIPIWTGVWKEGLPFIKQDAATTALFLALVYTWLALH